MGRHFGSSLAKIQLDGRRGVDREPLIRVHHDAEQAGVSLIKRAMLDTFCLGSSKY